jgi:two-component system OmpR family response regulator
MLLEYLMRNRGRVLSRTELLEHVWDVNADPFTNTIETHVRNIRKKIGIKGNNHLIRTVSGVGYKIE